VNADTPNRRSWPGGWMSNARVEAARTVEIDERAFTDLFLHLDRRYIPAADWPPILSGTG
jgi:hypothetical protein